MEALFSNSTLNNLECVKLINSDYQIYHLGLIDKLPSEPKIIVDRAFYDGLNDEDRQLWSSLIIDS